MFWISIAAISAATALVQLGALAVTVQILKVMLSVAAAVALLVEAPAEFFRESLN